MLSNYIDKVMQHVQYEQIEDGSYVGRIPGFRGVWANTTTIQECQEELREVLEGWILLNIADYIFLPAVDVSTVADRAEVRFAEKVASGEPMPVFEALVAQAEEEIAQGKYVSLDAFLGDAQ